MLSPEDIQRLCQRKYRAFLRSIVTGESFFPLEIRFGRPSTTDEWERLHKEISTLSGSNVGYRIDWEETNTRKWGRQKFPVRVWFQDEQKYIQAVSKRKEVGLFRHNLVLTRQTCPELEGWLRQNPFKIVENADSWGGLLAVCRYFMTHPRPGLYARELPMDVDTKFIERHQGILRNLLDFLLPDTAKQPSDRFEKRFGLRYDEPLIRFRTLDSQLHSKLGLIRPDLSTPLSQFQGFGWQGLKVVITENKMNFLTLPEVPDGIGIWGGGNAAELLTTANWLHNCRLIYWGDIDVHGFHILARIRSTFPHITSVMMDHNTLHTFHSLTGAAPTTDFENPQHLTPEERLAYEKVRDANLRLEQEKIPHLHVILNIDAALVSRG